MRRHLPRFHLVALVLLLCFGMAYADKVTELQEFKEGVHQEYLAKPWSLLDSNLPQFTFVDVNETEPNDACPGNGYTLGDIFHGEVNPGGDVDWISFTADAGTELTIGTDADGALPTVDTKIELYEDDCATMLVSNDDGGPGTYSLIDGYPLPYTGTYHLKVYGYWSWGVGNYIVVGTTSVPPPSESETEPNDVCPGNPFTIGTYIFHGEIKSGGDVDWVQFSCNAGDKITVGTAQDDALGTVDTKIYLYEDDCATQLAYDDDSGPGLYSLIGGVVAPYTGAYNLKIQGYSSTSAGFYILEGECIPSEPDDSCPGEEYVLGTDYHGDLYPTDYDWFTFECEAGDILTIGTYPDGDLTTVDTKIDLVEDDCATVIATNDDGGPGLYSLISIMAPYTGQYNLKVYGYSASSAGNYLLQGSCAPVPGNDLCESAVSITRCIRFYDEGTTAYANNDYTPSETTGGGCTGYYAQGGDLVYKLDLQGDEELHIEYWNSADASVYIITDCSDPVGSCVAGSDDTYSGDVETLDFAPSAAGIYYLIIDTYSAYTPGGPFWLSVDWMTCPTPNCPRSVGFWGQQALQRNNGSTKFDLDAMNQIAGCVDDYSAFFDWGDDDFAQFQVTILPQRQMTIRKQAKRQFAGLIANYCTGAIGLIASNGDVIGVDYTAPVSCSGLGGTTVGEVLEEVDGLLATLETEDLSDPAVVAQYAAISSCLDMINNGDGIGDVCVEVANNWVELVTDDELLAAATDVETGIDAGKARLFPARPSPFTGSTRLMYTVPASGADVRIEVYNLAGRRVRQIESGSRAPGVHEATWDGCNDAGAKVPASVYFLRAVIGDYTEVQRVVIMR